MEHKYNAEQEESILPTQYLPWKEVFEQKAAERFPSKHPWDHAMETEHTLLKAELQPILKLRNTLVQCPLRSSLPPATGSILCLARYLSPALVEPGRASL